MTNNISITKYLVIETKIKISSYTISMKLLLFFISLSQKKKNKNKITTTPFCNYRILKLINSVTQY